MTIARHLLAAAMRFAGRHRDAAEVEEAAQPGPSPREIPPDEIPPTAAAPDQPALVIHRDERDAAIGHGFGGDSPASESTSSSSAASASPTTGESASSSAGSSASAGSSSSASHRDGERSDAADRSQRQPTADHLDLRHQHQPDQLPNLHDDPLAGIRSDHLRERLERDAFASASTGAQDSAIARRADQLLPPELRGSRSDFPASLLDTSPAARTARINALHGQLPDWVRGDPSSDPALIRSASSPAAVRAADSPAHQPAQKLPDQPAHSPATRLAHQPAERDR